MTTDKLLDDLSRNLTMLADLKKWLSTIYYDQEFSTVFNRLLISFCIQAVDFIIESLTNEATKYATRKGFTFNG